MATHADFYIGQGRRARWLGSYRYNGSPENLTRTIACAENEDDYRAAVATEIAGRGDGITIWHGWPWSCLNSSETPYTYTWHDGTIWISHHGAPWVALDPTSPHGKFPTPSTSKRKPKFPNMSAHVLEYPLAFPGDYMTQIP